MKRIVILLAVLALSAGPCFAAAGSSYQHGSVNSSSKGGTQTNIINQTDVQGVNAIANDNSSLSVGSVENQGGTQTNVVNTTNVKDSNLISNKNSELKIGTVTNK